jgi:hypothetical protein
MAEGTPTLPCYCCGQSFTPKVHHDLSTDEGLDAAYHAHYQNCPRTLELRARRLQYFWKEPETEEEIWDIWKAEQAIGQRQAKPDH